MLKMFGHVLSGTISLSTRRSTYGLTSYISSQGGWEVCTRVLHVPRPRSLCAGTIETIKLGVSETSDVNMS